MDKNLMLGMMASVASAMSEEDILEEMKKEIDKYLITKDKSSKIAIEFNIVLWTLKSHGSPIKSAEEFVRDTDLLEKIKEKEAEKEAQKN